MKKKSTKKSKTDRFSWEKGDARIIKTDAEWEKFKKERSKKKKSK